YKRRRVEDDPRAAVLVPVEQQLIKSGPSIDRIRRSELTAGNDHVVVVSSVNEVITATADVQKIVLISSDQRVAEIPGTADESVVARSADQGVTTALPFEEIISA